jgi:hypothetical protein
MDNNHNKNNETLNQTNQHEVKLNHTFSLNIEFYHKPYNNIRLSKIILISDILSINKKFIKFSNEQKNNFVKRIEKSFYKYTLLQANKNNIINSWDDNLFEDLYHMHSYKILSNLNSDGLLDNNNFIDKIMDDEFDLDKIAFLSSKEIFPEKYTGIEQTIEKRKNVKQTLNTSKMYKCGRCGKNETILESLQMRSLDEGNSIFAICVGCSKKWQVA